MSDSTSSAKTASVIVYLHGGIVNQTTFDYQNPQVANEPIFQIARQYNAIVLYPFARKDFGWVDQEKAFRSVLKMIEIVKKRYLPTSGNVYLGGMSNGGTAAYWFATKYPDLFTGFYAFSPWPVLKLGPTAYDKMAPGKPFVSVNAKDDTVFSYQEVRAVYDREKSKAQSWHFKTLDEGGHGFIYGNNGMTIMKQVFEQLFSNKLQKAK